MPLPSSNELSTARSRTSASTQHQIQHQQLQQQHPFVSARVDQFTSRHQLTALQPIRSALSTAASGSGWLPGRKSSAVDEDNLDRLVEINAPQLFNRGSASARPSSAVRRPPQTTNVVSFPSTVYGRAKALPVTNNVAKPFSAGRNY